MVKTKVKTDEVSKIIIEYLDNYSDDIFDEVVESTDKITREATKELKQKSLSLFGNSGRDDPYYKGWTSKIAKRGNAKYHKVIWNRTNYQLTHLLEFGPHIRPVEEKYKVEFVDLLERKIGGIK